MYQVTSCQSTNEQHNITIKIINIPVLSGFNDSVVLLSHTLTYCNFSSGMRTVLKSEINIFTGQSEFEHVKMIKGH